jgi:hypothetical protein
MISHQNYINKISNSSVQTAYVFPRFYGSDLSCFNVHAPTCPRDTIIFLPDDKMASAETLNWLELLLDCSEFDNFVITLIS